jgi:hypothetical protein
MLSAVGASSVVRVEILIALETVEPPAGSIRLVVGRSQSFADEGDEIAFAGWLGLLRSLEELMRSPGVRRAAE